MITDENDEIAETPVTVFATLRNNLWAPRANESSSRFSAVYAFTIRIPPKLSPRRPVTSALIMLRSRNTGRKTLNAYRSARQRPKARKRGAGQSPIDVKQHADRNGGSDNAARIWPSPVRRGCGCLSVVHDPRDKLAALHRIKIRDRKPFYMF